MKDIKEYILENRKIPKENKNGDCYVVAYRYFMSNGNKNKDLRLVHGLVTGHGAIKGIVYNHAWCEDIKKNMVLDYTMPECFQEVPIEVYYALGQVQKEHKYTMQEVLDKSVEEGTYGPWEDELKKNKY